MANRTSSARWQGTLKEGTGTMALGSGAYEGAYSFGTRFGDDPGTNPEELIAAAHAGCFSMKFSGVLGENGYTPDSIETTATITFKPGVGITTSALTMTARIPNITEDEFQKLAAQAKETCPVSEALKAIEITLDATLA
jgi:osmotically inducible protein OsmC